MKIYKRMLMLSLLFVLILSAMPVLAEQSAKEEGTIEIELQLDNEIMLINGESMAIEKPFLANGTTLVPLRVITAAFGASITWDSALQKVGLKYGEHEMELTIGSKEAVVNNEKVDLPEAPQLVNNITMVPVRFIVETFGASLDFDNETYEIRITGTKNRMGLESANLDNDLGKTRIGNSYYGWSMKYPNGLINDYMSYKEEFVSFEDAQGEYNLWVDVEKVRDPLTENTLLKYVADYAYGTVLDRKYVKQSDTGYARIVTKEDKAYYEYRGYTDGEKVYVVTLEVEEQNYKNALKYQSYADLLDSFVLSFDQNDMTLKDLSTFEQGFRKYTNEDFGFSLNVPAMWNDWEYDQIEFYDSEEDQEVIVRITSIVEGDTLEQWVGRQEEDFTATFASVHRKSGPFLERTVDGVPAIEWEFAVKLTDKWSSFYGVYLFLNGYKYEFYFSKVNSQMSKQLVDQIVNSISFDDQGMNSILGYIHDDKDFIDKTKKVTITRKKENYMLDVPEFWEMNMSTDSDQLVLSFNAGSVQVFAGEIAQVNLFKGIIESQIEAAKKTNTLEMISEGNEFIAGVSAKTYEFLVKNQGETAWSKVYFFEHSEIGYGIIVSNHLATRSELNNHLINETLRSFRFID